MLDKTQLLLGGSADGSTYLDVVCDTCKKVIGKSFKSTTSATDIYRNTFSFDMDCVKPYVLGSCNLDRKEGITESRSRNGVSLVTCRFKCGSPVFRRRTSTKGLRVIEPNEGDH